MLFLVSLLLALLFAVGCRKIIKKHPVLFYLAAVVISLAAAVFPLNRVQGILGSFLSMFTRASFATALWAIVMWIGALPNGSKGIKALMPIRGELSITAAILTLGHNIGFGKTYFVRMFTPGATMPGTQRAAGCLSILMLLIMIPLTVISFPKIRRKIDPKRWKQVQRLAYLFYGFIYLHVMLLTYPQAKAGRMSARLSVLVYTLVFISYAVMRVRKYLTVRRKVPVSTALNSACAAVFAVLTAALVLPAGWLGGSIATAGEEGTGTALSEEASEEGTSSEELLEELSEEPSEESSEEVSEESSEEASEESSEEAAEEISETAEESSEEVKEESKVSSEPVKEESKPAETKAESKPTESVPASKPAEESKPAESAPASSEAAPEPEPEPAPKSVYKDGTFSGSAYGYDGNVYVTVTISGDKITSISVSSEESDPSYMDMAKGTVVSRIISAQSASVDGVSGATYSSKAIKQAVASALASAKN